MFPRDLGYGVQEHSIVGSPLRTSYILNFQKLTTARLIQIRAFPGSVYKLVGDRALMNDSEWFRLLIIIPTIILQNH